MARKRDRSARVFAQETKVPVRQTKEEIETLLVRRHGATAFGIMMDNGTFKICFTMYGRNIMFVMTEPETEQAKRARWRCMLLTIKSKIETTRAGIETFEQAFMAHTVMPDGRTVGDTVLPAIAQSYAGQDATKLLPGP